VDSTAEQHGIDSFVHHRISFSVHRNTGTNQRFIVNDDLRNF
jgi:hypothetical protein